MSRAFTTTELEAYLDEALQPEAMERIEHALRGDDSVVQQLAEINARRDAGVHTLGAIWRRARLSCPSRDQLGSYLLDALPEELADYVRFHLETVGCRYCQANLADLRARLERAGSDREADSRQKRYFQSSAGYLKKREK